MLTKFRLGNLASTLEIRVLRISLAIVYIWFGGLKTLDLSPAHDLVVQTITYFFPASMVPILGFWEVLIGACFLHRRLLPLAIVLFALHMPGTMMPLVVLQDMSFVQFPFVPSMVGQYIVKNVVLIGAVIVIAKAVIVDGQFPFSRSQGGRALRLMVAQPSLRLVRKAA